MPAWRKPECRILKDLGSSWGPFFRDSKKVRVVVPDVVCGEKFQCAGSSCLYYECMGKIEVDEVFESIQQLLGGEKL